MRVLTFLIIQLIVVANGLCPTSMFHQQRPTVFVFLPSNIRPHSLEKTLSEACPELAIQVFGRHRDLRKAVSATPPDAILVPQPVADSQFFANFNKVLLGLRDKRTDEEYVLLSVNQQVDLENIHNLAIGAVDLMTRKEMSTFITGKLTKKPKRIEQVVRLEDLLSLLQFQDVHAVFVSKQRVDEYYRQRSKMDLKDTPLNGVTVGLPVLATSTQDPELVNHLTRSLQAIDTEVKKKLGVDAWVSP